MPGYAVVDLETTGLRPSWQDRIVEIGVVLLDPDGEVEGTWETLVNPERDLGPQEIHGIVAADVLAAPTFTDVAGAVVDLLRGRTFVAHNAAFDATFLAASYRNLGWPYCSAARRRCAPCAGRAASCPGRPGRWPAAAPTRASRSTTTTPRSPTPPPRPGCCGD